MAKFPRREADVAALAGTMVFGLAQHAEDFTLGFLPFQIGEPRKDLLLGFVSDAAGVSSRETRA